MTHSSQGFAEHFIGLLKNIGDSGDTGDSSSKSFNGNDKSVTKFCDEVSPVIFDWCQPTRATGDALNAKIQPVICPVTSVTSVTSSFAGGMGEARRDAIPSEWHAILAGLRECHCPEWLSGEAWETLLADTENFLLRWGSAAKSLGWTALDLFGVHPRCPTGRFDAMGLIPLIQGAAVTALTTETAALRRASGARLTYRRQSSSGPVLLLDLLKTGARDANA